MPVKTVFFKDALKKAIEAVLKSGIEREKTVVLRDIYGRINVAFNGDRSEVINTLESTLHALGAYHVAGQKILCKDDLFDAEKLFSDPGIVIIQLPGINESIRFIDRQIVGQDWLTTQNKGLVPRLVFYGVKGGVGRSTAIAMLACKLANNGKKVLCIDLDLESPGISSLLLPSDSLGDFGLVDWYAEDAVGQGEDIIHRIVTASPLGTTTQGAISVAAAYGNDTGAESFMSKLARIYADINKNGKIERFADRTCRLIKCLEEMENPDVVLIDSRAGLHDIAAVSIVGLSTFSYFFITGTSQNWQDYRFLFSHWRMYPELLRNIRDRIVMVQSMFPEFNQEQKSRKFLEESYRLFSETVYETVDPGAPLGDTFNFDLNDMDAPHFPAKILWSNRLQEIEPLLSQNAIFADDLINASYNEFFKRVNSDLEGLNGE